MHTKGLRTRLLAIALAACTALPLVNAAPARAAAGRLKLIAATSQITIQRRSGHAVPIGEGVYVASLGGDFEIHVTRPDYATPIGASEWVDGSFARVLDPDMANGWFGLANFLHVRVKNPAGKTVLDQDTGFCPSSYDRQRLNDSGPALPRLPMFGCYANPFTLGTVWGIDEGWAVPMADPYGYGGFDAPFLSGRDGTYRVQVSFSQVVIDTFGIDPRDASVNLEVTLETTKHCRWPCYGPAWKSQAETARDAVTASASPAAPAQDALTAAPTALAPDPSTVPDLIPTPAFYAYANHDRHKGDFLTFGANVWNAGPAPLVVEGYRRSGSDVMDAFQYFYDGDSVVGRAPAGTLMYDARDGHQHWHFQQFARYSLLDATATEVVVSKKEAFCLAPTDPIDLTRPGAEWNPYSVGLSTACGSQSAIWIREVLDAGWGDTYYQWLPGQSFRINGLPNGRYYIQVEVNPGGSLTEADTSNNVSLRRIVLRGTPRHRRVIVPPYQSVDSDGCFFC